MTHAPPSEAAASSQHHNDPWSEATPERIDQAGAALAKIGADVNNGKPAPSPWRERFMRLRDSIKVQIAWCGHSDGVPYDGMHKEHAVLSCALRNADALLEEAAGVGPATGQPRTEVPVGPDGSGTVVELGGEFHRAMRMADRDCLCLTARAGETLESARLHHLHTAVAELAKIVERIGGRS